MPPEILEVLKAFDQVTGHYKVPSPRRREVARELLETLGVLKPAPAAGASEKP